MSIFANRVSVSVAAACLVLGAAMPHARGGVLPSSATPNGYSLANLAVDTAVYNTGFATGNPATPAAPNIPFTVLEIDPALSTPTPVTVPANTDIYVPIFYADNSPPIDPNFPASISNQTTDAAYLDSYVSSNYGVSAFFIQVDGVNTVLDDSYIVGVNTPALLDGSPGGTEYITDAVVLSPLSQGDHTVGFGGIISGSPVTFGSFAVSVPEPASMGFVSLAGAGLLRRRRAR
jgi:hypothetical protein